MTTYVSAIKPSGTPHLGNYFGAIAPHLEIINSLGPGDKFYLFIADLHALTTVSDAEQLRSYTKQVAATYQALSTNNLLGNNQVMVFRQSDVPEVTELMFLLATCTGVGMFQRCHAYKTAVENGHRPSVGLFTYPVLMAADILIYGADKVPVGEDQVQHINLAQDMGASFNARFSTGALKRPEPDVSLAAKVLGTDGRKMSKSYNNTIPIFAGEDELKKAIASIVTDSRPPDEPKDPDSINVFKLLELFLSEEQSAEMREVICEGGPSSPGYGNLKQMLLLCMSAKFEPARDRYNKLMSTPLPDTAVINSYEQRLNLYYYPLGHLLARGADGARVQARTTLAACHEACGLRCAEAINEAI